MITVPDCFDSEHAKRGGYISEDRRSRKVFHPLITLSLGTVRVEPRCFVSHHQIATAASEAKQQPKKITGNSSWSGAKCCLPATCNNPSAALAWPMPPTV
jgi:hypothetical protein